MKKIAYLAIIVAMSLLTGCSKIDIEGDFLEGTKWTGTLSYSNLPSDEYDSISFDFHKGYADFVYLEYATNAPEQGKALYTATANELTISKANDLIDGAWTVIEQKDSRLAMARSYGNETLTIELIRRR